MHSVMHGVAQGVVRSMPASGEPQLYDSLSRRCRRIAPRILLTSHTPADAHFQSFGERTCFAPQPRSTADLAKLLCCAPHRTTSFASLSSTQSISPADAWLWFL